MCLDYAKMAETQRQPRLDRTSVVKNPLFKRKRNSWFQDEGRWLSSEPNVGAIWGMSVYRWRREYGGMKVDQARRLKELEKENVRLRKAVSDLTLDKLILREALEGNY